MKTIEATITIKCVANDGKLYLQTGDGEVVSVVEITTTERMQKVLDEFVALITSQATDAARDLHKVLNDPRARDLHKVLNDQRVRRT